MANDDKNVDIPDETMVLRSDNLSSVLNTWKTAVNSTIGSIDVDSLFSSFISNEIGTAYFATLKKNISTISTKLSSVSSRLEKLVEEQQGLDKAGITQANNITDYANTNSNYSRRTGGTNYNATQEEKVDSSFTKKEFDECVASFNELDHVALITGLYEILKDNPELLSNEEYASKLQEEILKNPSIPEDLKKVVMNMDGKEVQVLIKNISTSGENVTGFSKEVLNTLEDKEEETIVKLSSDYPKAVSDVTYDNIQEKLGEIYTGDVGADISDDTVYVTRVIVDSVAESYNVTSNEVLTNSQYKDILVKCTADLIKTCSYIDYSNKLGQDSINKLYSNLFGEVKA